MWHRHLAPLAQRVHYIISQSVLVGSPCVSVKPPLKAVRQAQTSPLLTFFFRRGFCYPKKMRSHRLRYIFSPIHRPYNSRAIHDVIRWRYFHTRAHGRKSRFPNLRPLEFYPSTDDDTRMWRAYSMLFFKIITPVTLCQLEMFFSQFSKC